MNSSNLRPGRGARRSIGLFLLYAVGALAQSYSITPLAPTLQLDSLATGLNAQGQVVGEYQESGGHWHAFEFNGQFIDIGTLGGTNSESLGTNASGDVVGTSDVPSGAVSHAFLYRSGRLYDLNALVAPQSGWVFTSARSIADGGQIVGSALRGGQTSAFVLSPANKASCSPAEPPLCFGIAEWRGATTGSDSLPWRPSGPSRETVVLGTNAHGQSVGSQYAPETADTHAVLVQNGEATDLNSAILLDSGWVLLNAVAINDIGQIVGNGLFEGRGQAYLLTPLQRQSMTSSGGTSNASMGDIPTENVALPSDGVRSAGGSMASPASNSNGGPSNTSITSNRAESGALSSGGMLSADGATSSTTVNWLTITPTGNPVNFFGTQSGTLANPGDPTLNDFVTMVGWNANGGGGVANQSYPGLFDSWENHWCPYAGDSVNCYMERHVEMWDPTISRQYRPFSSAFNTGVPYNVNTSMQFSTLTFQSVKDSAQRRSVILPGDGTTAFDYFVGPWAIKFNTNGKTGGVIQQNNATNTAYVGMLWTDTNNFVNIGDSNAAGIVFGAPLVGMTFGNNDGLQWKDSGGTSRNLLTLDHSNNVVIGVGSSSVGHTQAFLSAGHQWRFLNNNGAIRILTLDESTHNAIFSDTGNNTNYRVQIGKSGTAGTLHLQDETASTGFTRGVVDRGAADTPTTAIWTVNGLMTSASLGTTSNCSSSSNPAICSAAAAGVVAIPPGTNPMLQVITTAVTANSEIFVIEDQSLGPRLSVTCNTDIPQTSPYIISRSAGSSFTILILGTFTTNPVCVSYRIVN